MNAKCQYTHNLSSRIDVKDHLIECDDLFSPKLSQRVVIPDYAGKLVSFAERFEAWCDSALVGLVAAYANDTQEKIAYISNVSVTRPWQRKNIAQKLICSCVEHIEDLGFVAIQLEVEKRNVPAISLYKRMGFILSEGPGTTGIMRRVLNEGLND